jgi:hypothetical protein
VRWVRWSENQWNVVLGKELPYGACHLSQYSRDASSINLASIFQAIFVEFHLLDTSEHPYKTPEWHSVPMEGTHVAPDLGFQEKYQCIGWYVGRLWQKF